MRRNLFLRKKKIKIKIKKEEREEKGRKKYLTVRSEGRVKRRNRHFRSSSHTIAVTCAFSDTFYHIPSFQGLKLIKHYSYKKFSVFS